MTKLNPCPDCGREPDLQESGDVFRVACWPCISTEYIAARTASGAMNAWNATTSEHALPVKTLRDEFAIAALTAITERSAASSTYDAAVVAQAAYLIADAMLEARRV